MEIENKNFSATLLSLSLVWGLMAASYYLKNKRIDDVVNQLYTRYPDPKKFAKAIEKDSKKMKLSSAKKKTVARNIQELNEISTVDDYKRYLNRMVRRKSMNYLWIFFFPGITSILQAIGKARDKGKTTDEIRRRLLKYFSESDNFGKKDDLYYAALSVYGPNPKVDFVENLTEEEAIRTLEKHAEDCIKNHKTPAGYVASMKYYKYFSELKVEENFGLGALISDVTNKDRAKYKNIKLGTVRLIPQGGADFNDIDQDAFYLVIRAYNKGFYLLGPYASEFIAKMATFKVSILEMFKFKNAHVVRCKGKDLLKKFPGMFKKVVATTIAAFSLGDSDFNFSAVNNEVKEVVDRFPYKKDYLFSYPNHQMKYSDWLKENHPDSYKNKLDNPKDLKTADAALAKDVQTLMKLAEAKDKPGVWGKVKRVLTSPQAKILYGVAGAVAIGLVGHYVNKKLDHLEFKTHENENKIKENRDSIDRNAGSIAYLRGEIAITNKNLDETGRSLINVNNKLNKLEDNINSDKFKRTQYRNELGFELGKLQIKYDNLKKEYDEIIKLRDQSNKLLSWVKDNSSTLENLTTNREQIAEYKKEIEQYNSRAAELKSNMDKLEVEISNLNTRFNDVALDSYKDIVNFSIGTDDFNFAAVNEEVKDIVDNFPYKKDYLKAAADPKFKSSYSAWLKDTHPDSFERLMVDPQKFKVADDALAKDVKVLKTLAKYGTTNPTKMQKIKKALSSPQAKILYGVAGAVAVGLISKYVYDNVPIKIGEDKINIDGLGGPKSRYLNSEHITESGIVNIFLKGNINLAKKLIIDYNRSAPNYKKMLDIAYDSRNKTFILHRDTRLPIEDKDVLARYQPDSYNHATEESILSDEDRTLYQHRMQ